MKFIQVFLEAQNLMSTGFKVNKYVKFNVTQKKNQTRFLIDFLAMKKKQIEGCTVCEKKCLFRFWFAFDSSSM